MNIRRKAAAVIAAASTVALAGCGGGDDDNGIADMSADEILQEAKSAAADVESASIAGSMVSDGEEISLDFQFADAGAAGTIGVQGAEFEILNIDGTMYMKGSADAWDQIAGDGTGQLVADKYVLIPESQVDSFGEFATFVELGAFVDDLLSAEGDVTVAEETEINGTKVIGLEDDEGVLYVATVGEPLPVRVEAPEGEEGAIDFEWDVDVDIEAPPEDEVIDLSELM